LYDTFLGGLRQRHHDEGDNASLPMSNEGDEASSMMVETHLQINSSNNAIVTRATIAITTTEMPAH
jgi:hypothetical protein